MLQQLRRMYPVIWGTVANREGFGAIKAGHLENWEAQVGLFRGLLDFLAHNASSWLA